MAELVADIGEIGANALWDFGKSYLWYKAGEVKKQAYHTIDDKTKHLYRPSNAYRNPYIGRSGQLIKKRLNRGRKTKRKRKHYY